MSRSIACFAVLAALLLSGCDMVTGALGIESPEKVAAARDADGRAIGGACRHAARAIEDCYMLNKKADRAAVFAGWRDMNDYMRENKIDPVTPVLGNPTVKAAVAQAEDAKPANAADKAPPKGEGAKAAGAKPHGHDTAKPQDS